MLIHLANVVATRLSSDRGATAVEYGLMVALIAVAIIAAVVGLSDQISDLFGRIGTDLGTRAA